MLTFINDLLWSKVLILMLIGLGLYFTIASRYVQLRYFTRMFAMLGESFQRQLGQLSSFQALMLSIAGRVGAGNIAGVSVAIMLGGPGAVFWMWVVALVGMATSYFECSLAQLYKRRQADGSYRGGPAFYIQYGLGKRWLAALYSVLLLITFGFCFTALQSFTVASSLQDTFGLPTYLCGLPLVVMMALVIFGGIRRIVTIADLLVPVMAVSYIAIGLFVVGSNLEQVPATLVLIVKSAFGLEPAFAGGIGAAIMMGVKRGLFSNEAGLGSAPRELRPWGSSGDLPRYRCKACGKTSNALTGTPMARLRKRHLWQDYAEALIQSLSVRKAAIHCGVSKNTAFLWRHRFLSRIAGHQALHASGIVEADETFFLESFKGQRELPRPPRKRGGSAKRRGLSAEQIPVLVVRDRSGQQADFKLEKLDAAHVGERLRPLVDVDAILCTDSAGVYAHFAKAAGCSGQIISDTAIGCFACSRS